MRPGRTLSALIVALVCAALALPASASLCAPARDHCAGMPAAMKALCAKMGTAMGDCCQKRQPSTPARSSSDEPAPAASPVAVTTAVVAQVAAPVAAGPVAIAFSRDAALHELGLFTLHSVFRI